MTGTLPRGHISNGYWDMRNFPCIRLYIKVHQTRRVRNLRSSTYLEKLQLAAIFFLIDIEIRSMYFFKTLG